MQPTLVGTIIQQNFSGVQQLAQKMGYPVPQTPQEAQTFFVNLRDNEAPQDFARYVMSVHPNWQLFGKNICNTMLPNNNSQPMQYRNACCGFVNADGSQNGNGNGNGNGNQMQNNQQTNQQIEIPQEFRQGFDFLSQRIGEIASTRNQNQIIQYGLVFVVGLVAGKVLFK